MNLFEFDMALQEPVFYMMRRGIRVDQEAKTRFAQEAHEEWDKAQLSLNEVAGRKLNVNSPKQIKEYLYEGLGAPKRTKQKRLTTDEDALRAIMAQAEHEMNTKVQEDAKFRWLRIMVSVKLILKIREMRKQISSYTGCPPGCSCSKPSEIRIDQDGRMRCTMSVGGTETMRFSHSKTLWDTGMNLATVPHKRRPMFIADEGYELAEFDLNRGESWVYTFLSMDPELMRIHMTGGDFHSETAVAIQTAFGEQGLTVDEIRRRIKEGDYAMYRLRYLGKKTNHASSYRMGPFRGAQVVNQESDDTGITVTPSQMGKAQKLWQQKYLGIRGWWGGIDRQLEETRTLITPYGRKRMFYGWMSDHLKKEATAYVPQSTSVGYLNRGMLRVYRELVAKNAFRLELLHQNHDSILVQYPIQHRESVIPEITSRLLSVVVINGHEVTIPVEAQIGQNWGDWNPEKNPEGLKEWKPAA